jgi:DNA-binding MarR family transcriptional regulator
LTVHDVNVYAHVVNTLGAAGAAWPIAGVRRIGWDYGFFVSVMAERWERGMTSRNGNLGETVELLGNVAGEEALNQRKLARQIGISVGLVNALVHRAVRKGLIKIKEAPARRYAYYLTPKGFAEKSRLVAEYLDVSLTFFRSARQEYGDVFARCVAAGKTGVILCWAGELAEIATLAANEAGVAVIGVLDQETNQVRVAGLPVLRDVAEIAADVALVITDGRRPQEIYDTLLAAVGPERVYAPPLLRISPKLLVVGGGAR